MKNISAVIDEALDACKALDRSISVCVSNRQVIQWLREHRPEIAEYDGDMADEHWIKLIAERRKARSPRLEARSTSQMCIDFGIPNMTLDAELSIPRNPADPLSGGYYWREADDATLEEVAWHITLLDAQAGALREKAKNWRVLYRAAARFAGGNIKRRIAELRALARETA